MQRIKLGKPRKMGTGNELKPFLCQCFSRKNWVKMKLFIGWSKVISTDKGKREDTGKVKAILHGNKHL